MNHPQDLKYASTHEWVRVDGNRATVGITDYAQHELGDVVYLELPEVGRSYRAGVVFGTVESVKAVSDLYAPISGEIAAVNAELPEKPEAINSSPYDTGWLVVVEVSDPAELAELMDAAAYEASITPH